MVYAHIIVHNTGFSEAKNFRSEKKMIEYCWDLSSNDSIEVSRSFDSSFDYSIYIPQVKK